MSAWKLTQLTIATLLLFAPASRLQAADCSGDLDYLHPKNFIRVYEVTQGDQRRHNIFDNRSLRDLVGSIEATAIEANDAMRNHERRFADFVTAEVDIDSRIYIEFDREWIRKHSACFEAVIQVTGELSTADTNETTPIEIPGYYQIGEKQETAKVLIGSVSKHAILFRTLWKSTKEMDELVIDALDSALSSLSSRSVAQVPRYDYFRESNFVAKEVEQAIRLVAQRGDLLLSAVRQLNENQSSLQDVAAVMKFDGHRVATASRLIVDDWFPKLVKLDEKLDEADADIDALSKQGRDLLESILRGLETITSELAVLEDPAAVKDKIEKLAIDSRNDLPDANLHVKNTSARPGDNITLKIQNGDVDSGLARSMEFSLGVDHFGFRRRISDSFLFVERQGVSSSDGAAAESAGAEEAASTGEEVTVSTPAEARFVPTPGVTLGWHLRPRKPTLFSGGYKQRKFLRWLEPGVGINVSFPRFGNKVTKFDRVADQSNVDIAQVTFEESDDDIDIGVGVVASFFDNRLQLTYGWNLSEDEKRQYIGIGFSFVEVLRGASTPAAGEK